MTHLMEPALVKMPGASKDVHDKNCVFCKDAKAKGPKSFIGDDNNPDTLETRLTAQRVPRRTFKHRKHGAFSSEPHHLMPGKEALKGHDVEKWLATRASGSQVEADTGFDINSHFNGVWLPSVPVSYVGVSGWSWRDPDCQSMAIDLMMTTCLQFHKGNHTNKGGLDRASSEPDRCYITMVERRLDDVVEHVEAWVDKFCPIAKKAKKGKRPPPFFLNDLLYRYVSAHMMKEVSGAPKKWTVFISRVAFAASEEAKTKPKKRPKPASSSASKRRRR
ncbi:AHH domain-containing protein [Pyxidicoccus sp. MSG2]|uniref:AHH domain-containing protein n=1 Tax=Pyxidicoccus sp. MSG2 TaxID=2996790 RepID=UPI00226F0DCC|nr:AHH domain-containing protein [Pyxidicoccus sp. MSG2]MCY1017412.1 AHH domain-containing protein [Pyxidicoccus sp. MSG2]